MRITRSPLFILAVLSLLMSGGFRIEDGGAQWFWSGEPWVAGVLVVLSAVLFIVLFVRKAQHADREHA